ncbi:hypothetical protein [Deinococcus cavernae]
MKHILFPTVADADAFIADLQSQGVARPELGNATFNRRTTTTTGEVVGDASAGAEDAGAGAVKGTGVGALVGAAAGVLGAGAVVATGGLALPVILGMTALGSGVGAAVGAAGGAAGIDENADGRTAGGYDLDDNYYDEIHTSVSGGGRAVAVEDNVPADVLNAAVSRHNGRFVAGGDMGMAGAAATAGNTVARTGSAAGDVASAAGHKIEEGADRLRAVGHEVAGAVTGNPKHDMLAAEDRAKANMNNDQADRDMLDADRKV